MWCFLLINTRANWCHQRSCKLVTFISVYVVQHAQKKNCDDKIINRRMKSNSIKWVRIHTAGQSNYFKCQLNSKIGLSAYGHWFVKTFSLFSVLLKQFSNCIIITKAHSKERGERTTLRVRKPKPLRVEASNLLSVFNGYALHNLIFVSYVRPW